MVCKQVDEWLRDFMEHNTIWIATLNNDEKVYCDDFRPGVVPESAWLRLKSYCQENGLYIKDLIVKFRSNCIGVESGCDGYFFSKALRAYWGANKNINFFIVGTLKNGILVTSKYRVPELIFEYSEERDIDESKENLICKNMIQSTEQVAR